MTTGRSFERLVNFTDAVVAVAITLLVLSIVDIRGASDEETVWQVIADNASQLIAFAMTFLVVAVMWSVHTRVFNGLRGFDRTIFRLNLLWLMAVVLLPWPSAMFGEGFRSDAGEWSGGQGLGGAGLLYWGTLTFIALMSQSMIVHIRRHPELLDPDGPGLPGNRIRGVAFITAFATLGVTSVFAPVASMWLALGLIPLGIALGRLDKGRVELL